MSRMCLVTTASRRATVQKETDTGTHIPRQAVKDSAREACEHTQSRLFTTGLSPLYRLAFGHAGGPDRNRKSYSAVVWVTPPDSPQTRLASSMIGGGVHWSERESRSSDPFNICPSQARTTGTAWEYSAERCRWQPAGVDETIAAACSGCSRLSKITSMSQGS